MEFHKKKKRDLNRAVSFHDEIFQEIKKSETGSTSILSRLKSLRGDRRGRSVGDARDSDTTTLDDIFFLESFSDHEPYDEGGIIVCKDSVKQNLIECMKSKNGNVDLLEKIENGLVVYENMEYIMYSATAFELNVAFLWSVLLSRKDLLPFFIRRNVDLNFVEPQQGFSALHISSLIGCLDCTEMLLNHGVDPNPEYGNYTPLHCAAFGNSVATAKLLLKAGAAFVPKPSSDGSGCLETPLHSAVRARALDCIRLFISEISDVDCTGHCGFTPLHLAADLGYAQCLQVLLDSGRCGLGLRTTDRSNTALHLAAENGFAECVKLLLENGSDSNLKNYRQQTALHVASRCDLECVNLLLKYGADPNSPDADDRTPLHSAVGKSECEYSLDITKSLIDAKGDVNRRDKYGYTSLHVAALTELTDCVEYLILQGADVSARTRGGTSALSIICRKTPSAVNVLRQKLDECVIIQDSDSSKDLLLKYNFRYLIRNCPTGEISFLQTFVEEGQKDLLDHPVCQAFLYLKWEKIRKFYIARLIFGFIHVLLLSAYVIMALAYQCYNDSVAPETKSRILNVDFDLCVKKSFFGDFLRNNPMVMEIEWFILAFITMLEIIRKIFGFRGYRSFRHYVSQTDNLAEWFVVASVFLTSFVYTGHTYIWQNHVGALAVLCGWANLMIMIGNLPIFGVYVTMYTKVQKEFTKLFSAYFCLLIGFTVCFCVIFPDTQQFSNPFIALIKILVMMTGELEFDNLLENITKDSGRPVVLLEISAFTAFILFLIFVTIILMNLLIGIAVHDIQGLQKTAGLSKLVGQTKLISHIESALFNGCLPGCMLKLLRMTALISPSSYRVVFSVKPLNPRESLLPKNVMRMALELANQKKGKNPPSRWTTLKRAKYFDETDGELLTILIKLSQEVEKLREAINEKQAK